MQVDSNRLKKQYHIQYYYRFQLKKQKMIPLSSIIICAGYIYFFLMVINLEISFTKNRDNSILEKRYIKTKLRILLLLIVLVIFSSHTYITLCYPQGINLLECFYVEPNKQFLNNMAIGLFINTTLYLGGLHQQLYNGGIKKKFMNLYKPTFQWNLFKKLFVIPVFSQWLFRALMNRNINANFEHDTIFTFFSGIAYSLSHIHNYDRFEEKYGDKRAKSATIIQCIYNFAFGLYCSHIFVKRKALISSIVIQGYGNFMGYPQYFEILKGHVYDERIRKTTVFYCFGVIACLCSCLLL